MATTVSTLLSYVENKTQAGTGTINNTTLGVPFLNEALLDFRSELLKRGINASQTQESYTNGSYSTAGGVNYSTFAFPSDMYLLKTIELNMTTGAAQDYVQAVILDASNPPDGTSWDDLRVNQNINNPFFANYGDTFEVFPSFARATNTTNAIKIIYFLTPTLYVNLSDILTYPDSLDWYILAERVASIYYQSLNKFQEADVWATKSNDRTEKLITSLAQGSEQPITPQQLQGNQTGLEGWAY